MDGWVAEFLQCGCFHLLLLQTEPLEQPEQHRESPEQLGQQVSKRQLFWCWCRQNQLLTEKHLQLPPELSYQPEK